MIALDPRPDTGSFPYVLRSDRKKPKEEQTTWHLRPLEEDEWATILDAVYVSAPKNEDGEEDPDFQRAGVASTAFAVLKKGIVKVENILDTSKKPIDLTDVDVSSDEFLCRIPWSARIELAGAIEGRTRPDNEDVEKSEPSLTE